MRSFGAAALAAAALCAGAAAAQQSTPAPSPKPAAGAEPAPSPSPSPKPAAGATAAQQAMPTKQSADAQMSGPAETELETQTPLPAEKPATPDSAAAAGAAGAIVPDADPDAILALAKAGGDARLVADEYGDPLIEAIAGKHPYTVAFFDCSQNRDCQSVMFRAGFRASGQSAGQMADWNREQRFGKAYLDEVGNPVVEFNVNLAGGVTRANLANSVDRWQAVLAGFAEQVGY